MTAAPPTIQFIGDMQRLQMKPGDVFVVKVKPLLNPEQTDWIHDQVVKVLGAGTKVLVLSGPLEVGILHEGAE